MLILERILSWGFRLVGDEEPEGDLLVRDVNGEERECGGKRKVRERESRERVQRYLNCICLIFGLAQSRG